MKHRVFLAINIPSDVKERLLEFKKYWGDLPVHPEPLDIARGKQRRGARWTKSENIHITLVFIGYVTDEELERIKEVTSRVAQNHPPFTVSLSRIFPGPPHATPRMIWAGIKKSQELSDLQKKLEGALYESSGTGYNEKEKRPYSPHLTLCRFDPQEFRRSGFNKNDSFDIDFSFRADSIEVMESILRRTGAEYSVVKSFSLGNV